MEELLTLIRKRCSTTDPKKTSPQGFWIEEFDSSEIVNRHLRGAKLKVYPGRSVPQQVWIDVAPAAGPFAAGTFSEHNFAISNGAQFYGDLAPRSGSGSARAFQRCREPFVPPGRCFGSHFQTVPFPPDV
jgi:hypothetical protein